MHLRCPNCGAGYDLDALIGFEAEREAARQALIRVFALGGDLGRALVQYIGLFRPDKRDLSMKRVASLLDELLPDIERGRIERHGRAWAAPAAAWVGAINHMLEARPTLRLPLKSHGYLYEIIAGAADRHEAAAETKVEQTRRYNPSHGTRDNATAPRSVPGHIRDQLRNFTLGMRVGEDHDNDDPDRQ